MRPISPGASGGRRKEYASGPAGGLSGLIGRVACVGNASATCVGFGGSELLWRSMKILGKTCESERASPRVFSMEHRTQNVQSRARFDAAPGIAREHALSKQALESRRNLSENRTPGAEPQVIHAGLRSSGEPNRPLPRTRARRPDAQPIQTGDLVDSVSVRFDACVVRRAALLFRLGNGQRHRDD